MNPIRKEIVWIIYAILVLILALLGYFLSKTNKIEYSLSGALIGILISLILWIVWGSKNTY
jgi:energy-coupling factor transporter transmembrane protein EcfT